MEGKLRLKAARYFQAWSRLLDASSTLIYHDEEESKRLGKEADKLSDKFFQALSLTTVNIEGLKDWYRESLGQELR